MEIAPGVYQLEIGRASNCFLVSEPAPTLIDTGVPRREGRIAEELARLGLGLQDVRSIILTHHHLDHIGSAQELRRISGARVYLHPLDVPHALGEKSASGAPPLKVFNALMRRRMQHGPPSPTLPLEDGQELGGFRIVHTPGHTPGHVSLLRDGVLFVGDAFVTGEKCRETPRFLNHDPKQARDSLRKLLSLPFHTVVSGHGEPITDARAKLERLVAGF